MQYGMRFARIALEESMELERMRLAATATAVRVARFAEDEEFQKFVNDLNSSETKEADIQPISDADIKNLFG